MGRPAEESCDVFACENKVGGSLKCVWLGSVWDWCIKNRIVLKY